MTSMHHAEVTFFNPKATNSAETGLDVVCQKGAMKGRAISFCYFGILWTLNIIMGIKTPLLPV